MDAINKLLAIPLVSVLIGAAITWLVAWWYYFKAGRELRDEAEKLRRASDMIVYCLTNPGAEVEAKRDDDGHVVGLYVNMQATLTGAGSMKASANTGQQSD